MDKIEIGKKYRHFKGHIIEVTGIAKHSENLENMVLYKHLGTDEFWVRPEKMFLEEIPERPDNITGQKHRFELCEELQKNYTK